MGNKDKTIRLLEADNSMLRAEVDGLRAVVKIKDKQIMCLNKVVILESEIIGERNAKERLGMITECCCDNIKM